MKTDKPSHTLPIGYILHNDYTIESVIGEGGFGITYRAYFNDQFVAIKEYYPSGIATRNTNEINQYFVTHFDGKMAVSFQKGIERFRQEAYLLKEFCNLKSIVSIIDIFDENNTTYIVMKYIEGLTLQKLIEREGPLKCSELIELMTPLINDLSIIHENGLVHRDISPDNLLIGTDNLLHLIDFGSANHNNINESKTFTVILKAGYAPPEQYSPKGKLGPWTDVYGCCATMYYALTGHAPMDSLQRMQHENADYNNITLPKSLPAENENIKSAILTGLSLSYKERFPSVKMLLLALTTKQTTDNIKTEMRPTESKKIGIRVPIITMLVCVAIFISLRGFRNKFSNMKNTTLPKTTELSISEAEASEATTADTTASEATANSDKTTEAEFNLTTKSNEVNDDILTMINMIGKSEEQAQSALKNLDPSIEIQTIEEYSKTFDKGLVIAQSIQSKTQFTKGNISTIVLTISLGEKPVSTSVSSDNSSSNQSATTQSHNVKRTKKDDGYTTIHIGD